MENHKYSLQSYAGIATRHRCPQCGENRVFSRYIDNETEEQLADHVGRCNRESSCGYHYKPKEYFADNNITFDSKMDFSKSCTQALKLQQKPKREPSLIDAKYFKQSLQWYKNNNFVKSLYEKFDTESVSKAIERYFVGTSKKWDGANVFWQIDLQNNVRTGKIMLYDKTLHRVKTCNTWAHSELKLNDFVLSQCFFGEHLLKDTTKTVAVVESEKSAIIGSIEVPKYIWLATAGKNGLNIDKCRCLQGRNVILFPDAGCADEWRKKAEKIKLGEICNYIVSDLIENAEKGLDVADFLIREREKQSEMQAATHQPEQTPPPEKESITEPEIERIGRAKKETADYTDEVLELETYFSTATLPTTPVKLNAFTTVNDARVFIDSSLSVLKANITNAAYLPYLERLQQFKQLI